MRKLQLLEEIRKSAGERLVTRDEVTEAFDRGARGTAPAAAAAQAHAGVSNILYYVGAAVVFLGIGVLVFQHWSALNPLTKVIATLGSGVAAYIAAVFLSQDERFEAASRGLYFLSALAVPIGLHVQFHLAGFDTGSFDVQAAVSGILLATFGLSYLNNKKTVFVLFNIVFATWLFMAVTNRLAEVTLLDWNYGAYRVLLVGLVYAVLGYCYTDSKLEPLTGWLYGFGSLMFLGSALALGGWKPDQNVFWELLFPVLTFGVMFLSVRLKSRAFLTYGSVFLMAYILKLTSEYFADSMGWPLALVITGFGLIAIGYVHFNVRAKYLS